MEDFRAEEIYQDFKKKVNMTGKELEDWLEKDESKSVGVPTGDGTSKGRKSAKKIVKIKDKNKDELTEEDLEHMKKVNAYVARHTAQKPSGDVSDTNWRYSLMNWGHDPLK